MVDAKTVPDQQGRFGSFGGRFVPETLMTALEELESAYDAAKQDREFQQELTTLNTTYAGRPTPPLLRCQPDRTLWWCDNLPKA